MARPIAQDDEVTAPRTVVRPFNLFDDHGNGPDTDPDGDRISVSRVDNKISWVGRSFELESGARAQIQADGTLIFNPNGAYDDLGAGESATELLRYTIRDSDGEVDHATVEVTVNGPASAAEGVYFVADDGDGTRLLWRRGADGSVDPVRDAATEEPFQSGPLGETGVPLGDGVLLGGTIRIDGNGEADVVAADGVTAAAPIAFGRAAYFVGTNSNGTQDVYRVGETGDAEAITDFSDPGDLDRAFDRFDGSLYFSKPGENGGLYRINAEGEVSSAESLLPDGTTDVEVLNVANAGENTLYLAGRTDPDESLRYMRLDANGELTELSVKEGRTPGELFELGGTLYGHTASGSGGTALEAYTTDDEPSDIGPSISDVAIVDDAAYFVSFPDDDGPMVSRMTADGEIEEIDELPSEAGGIREVMVHGGSAYFTAIPLWSDDERLVFRVDPEGSDGEPEVTEWPSELGDTSLLAGGPVGLGSHVYMVARNETRGEELWRADADGDDFERVTDIDPGPDGSAIGTNLIAYDRPAWEDILVG